MVKHFVSGAVGAKYRSTTPDEWIGAAAQCTGWVNRLSGGGSGGGLVVSIGPEAAKEAGTAHFVRGTGEIELNTGTLLPGARVADFDLSDRLWQLRNAPFVGAMAHEVAHARYSVAMPLDLALARWGAGSDVPGGGESYSPRELDVVFALEESRVEALLLRRRPELRVFLRRMALEIVNKDFRVAGTRYGASMGAALTVARVDAGSVSREAGKRFGKALRERLSYETLLALRVLWREYQALEPGSLAEWPHAEVKRIAADWIRVVAEDEHEDEDSGSDSGNSDLSGSAGEADGASGESGESGEPGEFAESGGLADVLDQIAREEGVDADTDVGEQVRRESEARRVEERAVDADRRARGKSAADKAFRRSRAGSERGHARGPRRSGRRAVERRAPSPAERAAAVVLARELAKVSVVDKVVVRGISALPPGRLRGSGAVLEAAQRSQGVEVSARPWNSVSRRRVESGSLRVAVLADVSGSMGMSEEPLGVMSYVIAGACGKVDARYCAVLFGDEAEGVVAAGTRVGEVCVADACDGSEAVGDALRVADGELDLLDGGSGGGGARVVVLLTDAHFVDRGQAEYCRAFMALCRARGVTVVWCHWGSFRSNYGWGSVVDLRELSAAECALAVGREVVAAVKRNQA